jgi:hypothetical protein
MQLKKALGGWGLALAVVSSAHATLTISTQQLPLAAGAATDDPQLLADSTHHPLARTFELDVTQSGGEKFTFASMLVTLGGGSFYIPTTFNSHIGQELNYTQVGRRHLQNDTFLTAPDGGSSLSLLGKSDYPVTSPGNGKLPGVDPQFPTDAGNRPILNTPATIDFTWGQTQAALSTKPNGIYAVARVTTLGMASGQVVGHMGGTQHNFTDVPYAFNIPLPFDFNGDGFATTGDISDALLILNGNFATYQSNHPSLPLGYPLAVGDLNGDGVVATADVYDYLFILDNAGASQSDEAPLLALVPEPVSLSLLAIASLLLKRRRS